MVPKILEQRRKKIETSLKKDGRGEKSARRIAYASATKQLQEEGKLRPGTQKLAGG